MKKYLYTLKALLRFVFVRKKPRILLINTPKHGNLGDQALAQAEFLFFQDMLPEYTIVELNGVIIVHLLGLIRLLIRREDIIAIHAGGYLGDLWALEEKQIMNLIRGLYNHRIIIMPQTCYYKDYLSSQIFKDNKEFYSKFSNISFVMREGNSYNFFIDSEFYKKENIHLLPDMVTYLSPKTQFTPKDTMLLCFRDDHEKVIGDEIVEQLREISSELGLEIKLTSMVMNYDIYPYDREEELQKKFNEFASSKIVVTDRLHGMLFAAVNNTPCIAFDNVSKKVSGVYEWVKDTSAVRLINPTDLNLQLFKDLLSEDVPEYDNKNLQDKFLELASLIRK